MTKYVESGDYFITGINGKECTTVNMFLEQIGSAFSFPEHFGRNMDALNDCLNDLDWIDKDNYVLIINNFDHFLSSNYDDKNDIVAFLEEIKSGWENYSGEDNDVYRKKSDFIIIYN